MRGNANLRNDYPTHHPLKPVTIHYRILAFLDSGFRRNDDAEEKRPVAIPTTRLPFLVNAWPRPLLSFRRRPESSGLYNPFPLERECRF